MIGTTLGPYRIDRELGSGGMGKVYAATVTGYRPGIAKGTRVALKEVHSHLLETPGFFKRFLREAELGKSVIHENVVRTFDVDAIASGGVQHNLLVMEYVEGETLQDLAKEFDRVPEELCRHIGREVSKGLAAIHAAGAIHRDVKPENVIITKEHVVKVMDLGLARLNDEADRLSQTGTFVGSIHHAAPECFADSAKQVDGRADLHALGLVLYELSCGVNPYYAESVLEVLKKVLHEQPRRLGDVNPQLSPFFEEVVHTLLAKNPNDRFADAPTLFGVLEEGEKSEWWKSRTKAIRAVTHQPLRRIRIPRETAVYGRENEIARLRGLFEKAKSGEGQVVLIDGEAGIGKSRVVDELIGRLQRDGEESNFLFGSYPPGGAATASGAFSTAFHEQFGADGSAAYLKQTPLLVPAFDALLSGDAPPSGASDVETLTKDSLQTCFVHALRTLAAERPTILLIDDLHFAPEDARSLFTSLAMAAPGHRILLVGTTRPGIDEKRHASQTRQPQTSPMHIGRLVPEDLVALLEDTLKSEALAAQLSKKIGAKSDGNPFFVFEIIRELRDGQFLTQKGDGAWVSTRVIDDIKIPSSILDLVNARVADLSEEDRDLLDVACCWGFEFDPAVIAAAIGAGPVPMLKQCGRIERRHRLVRSLGRHYVFDHHQVQEALYGALNEQLREQYHAALATALETRAQAADKDPTTLDGALSVDLCEHFLRGARGERALRYLTAAHAHLRASYLNDAEVRLAERALAVPELLVGAQRVKALRQLSDVLNRLGHRKREEEAAREALRLAESVGDEEEHPWAALALGRCFLHASRLAEAETMYRRAQVIARTSGDRSAEASVEVGLGNAFWFMGRHEPAREHFERAMAISREIGNRKIEAIAMQNLGLVFRSLGRDTEAQWHYERDLLICREIGDREGEFRAMMSLGNILHSQGRIEEAHEHYVRSLAGSREMGDRRDEGLALHNLGENLLEMDDAAAAKERLAAALTLGEEIGFPFLVAHAHLSLGSLYHKQAQESLARESWTKSLEESAKLGLAGPATLSRCGLSLLPGGDWKEAERSFNSDEERMDARERLWARFLLWEASGQRSHLAEAKRLLDELSSTWSAETRESALTNLRLNREILAACKAQGL